jgi:SP family galactose:H+ symporter-like MFS transporter
MSGAQVLETDVPSHRLFLLVLLTSLSLFNFGYNTASISGALLYIDEENVDCSRQAVCLTSSFEKGYVVSSCLLGACFGAIFAGSLADRFGRRTMLLANNFFYILGPLGMAAAPGVHLLAAARALAGIGVGISSALVHVYIGENVPASRRGEHGAILVMMGTGGVLMANVAAYVLGDHWRTVLALAALPAALQLAFGPAVMPESACWLRQQEQRQRGAMQQPLLLDIEEGVQKQRALASPGMGREDSGWKGLWLGIKSGKAVQPLFVGIGLQFLQQVSGINVAVYYGPKIFTMAGFSKDASTFLCAVLSLAQMVATLLLARVVDRVGRRFMSFLGIALMVVSLVALGTAFLPLLSSQDAEWLAVGSMLVFRVAFSISLGPLPYIITAEIFPGSCRASGVSLCWFVNWASNCGVSLAFLPLLKVLHTSGTFFMYASVCVLAMIFVKFCVPETSGQALEEPESARSGRVRADSRPLLGSCKSPCPVVALKPKHCCRPERPMRVAAECK